MITGVCVAGLNGVNVEVSTDSISTMPITQLIFKPALLVYFLTGGNSLVLHRHFSLGHSPQPAVLPAKTGPPFCQTSPQLLSPIFHPLCAQS